MKRGNGICTDNPNVLFSECLRLATVAERRALAAVRSREQVRRAMYRTAVLYQRLAKEHHAWFLAQANSVGGIDALLEGWFRPLALFGEDWRELLRDVANGVSEREYLGSSAGSFTRRRKVARLTQQVVSPPLPPPPDASLPPAEQVRELATQNETLRQQLRAAYRQVAELRQLAARQERRIAELETALNRIQKATVRARAS